MDTEWICFDVVTGYDKGELNHAAQILRLGRAGCLPDGDCVWTWRGWI